MSTTTVLSDCSSRHRHGRKGSSKKSLIVLSDHFDDQDTSNEKDPARPRSSSSNSHVPGGLVPPRMAQLETLEAKMASIEVSLSTTPRRRKSGPLSVRPREPPAKDQDPIRAQFKDKENMIQSLKDQLCTTMNISRMSHKYIREGGAGAPLPEAERRAAEERSTILHQDIDAKRMTIKNLKGALDRLDITDNIDVRIQQAELEYQLGREELELLTLLEQSRALLLLIEQDDHAKTKQDQQTIYSCIEDSEIVTIHAVQVEYDPKSPQFGAGSKTRQPGLWLEWALEHTGMCKGDRLLEVNGKLVLTKSKDDMIRLLSISPSPAQLVVMRIRSSNELVSSVAPMNLQNPQSALAQVGSLRAELDALREQAEEARRTKDGLRSDNLRLTHRISYLEEQVADLLERKKSSDPDIKLVSPHKVMTSTVKTQKNVTNISITSDPTPKSPQSKSDVQVFQKGPDVTAIVANLPGLEIGGKDTVEASANLPIITRPRSNQSNISSTQIEIGTPPKSSMSKSCSSVEHNEPSKRAFAPTNHVHYNHKYNKNSNSRYSLQPSRSSNFLSQGEDDIDSNSDKKYCLRQSLSHHSIHNQKEMRNFDYNSETSAALEIIKKNQRQYIEANYRLLKEKKSRAAHSDDNSDIIKSYKRDHRKSLLADFYGKESKLFSSKASETQKMNGHYPTKENKVVNEKRNFLSHKDEYSDFHPERDYIDHRIDGKIIQNAHKSSRRLSKLHMRSMKTPDCDSEPTQITNDDKYKKSRTKMIDYTSEPNSIIGGYNKKIQFMDRPRPTPPKKPLRLSLHRAQSMQSVEPENGQNERFYLHDPQERLKMTESKINDEIKYSLANSHYDRNGKNESYLYREQAVNNRLKQAKEYSKSEEIIENSSNYNSDKDRTPKKRPNHESEQNGYGSSRSESLSSISKNPRVKQAEENSSLSTQCDEYHYNGLKRELYMKAHQKSTSNGHAQKEQIVVDSPKAHHGFKWSTPTIFKNIRIDSSPRTNGHVSDGSKK